MTAPRTPFRPRETLRSAWDRFAELPATHPFGGEAPGPHRRGWTTALLDVVEPFTTGVPQHPGDVVRFRDLPWTAAAQLLELLPPDASADRQNDAPSLGSVLRAAVAHPGELEVHGYLVPPSRVDERLTAEGVVVHGHPELEGFGLSELPERAPARECACGEFWACVQASFGLTDATSPPQVVSRRECRRTGRRGWYLWWT